MYRVACNTAMNMRRKKRGTAPEASYPGEELVQGQDPSVAIESAILLKRVFRALTFPERALLFMHLEKCSYAEIGDYLGISPSNVGVRLHRVKQKTKTLLEVEHGH